MEKLRQFFRQLKELILSMPESFRYALDMFILRTRFQQEERRLAYTTGFTGSVLLYLGVDKDGKYCHRFSNEVISALEKEIRALGYLTYTEAGGTYLEFKPNLSRIRR